MGRYDRASGTTLPLHRGAAPARPAIERARATRRLAARRLRRVYRFPLRVGVGVGAGLLPWRRDRQYLSRGLPGRVGTLPMEPLQRNDQSYTFNTNASWMKGAHEIRFGFDFLHHLMNHWQPELSDGLRGAISFGNAVTALSEPVSDSRVALHRLRTAEMVSRAFCWAHPRTPGRVASSSR